MREEKEERKAFLKPCRIWVKLDVALAIDPQEPCKAEFLVCLFTCYFICLCLVLSCLLPLWSLICSVYSHSKLWREIWFTELDAWRSKCLKDECGLWCTIQSRAGDLFICTFVHLPVNNDKQYILVYTEHKFVWYIINTV